VSILDYYSEANALPLTTWFLPFDFLYLRSCLYRLFTPPPPPRFALKY
jgi:hypothetical protein